MNDAVQSRERRVHPRLPVSLPVYLGGCEAGAAPLSVAVLDMSLGGMAITPPPVALAVGQSICLCLNPDPNSCAAANRIEALVMHVEADRIGLQFAAVGVDVLHDIQRLLRQGRYF